MNQSKVYLRLDQARRRRLALALGAVRRHNTHIYEITPLRRHKLTLLFNAGYDAVDSQSKNPLFIRDNEPPKLPLRYALVVAKAILEISHGHQ